MATKAKLDYKKTILIGFGFMATSIAWAIYDPYVTRILNEILGRSEVIASWGQKIAETFPFVVKLMEAQGESTVDATVKKGDKSDSCKGMNIFQRNVNEHYQFSKKKVIFATDEEFMTMVGNFFERALERQAKAQEEDNA